MTVAGYTQKVTTVTLIDPAAAAVTNLLMKAPAVGMTINAAYASCSAAIASHATNIVTISLIDGGAAGQGTTEIASFGGADTAFVANTAHAMTVTADGLDGGDHLLWKYAEGGTVAPGYVTVTVEWTAGGS